MNISFQYEVYCPACGVLLRTPIWDLLLGRVSCNNCGRLRELIKIEPQGKATRILVPPDSLSRFQVTIAVFALVIWAVVSLTGGFGGFIAFLILLGFLTFILVIVTSVRALNLVDRYLYSKEIVLEGTTISIKMLRRKGVKTVNIDCAVENKPSVSFDPRLLSNISINSGNRRISFGSGFDLSSLPRIVDVIQSFFDTIFDASHGLPQAVVDVVKSVEQKGRAVISDDEGAAEKSKVEIIDLGRLLILKTTARWDVGKWLQALIIATIAIFVIVVLWSAGYKFGVGISIGVGMLAFMMDITVEISSYQLNIVYRIFGLISWKRKIPISDIIDVGDNWIGCCAIITPKRSYRISHLSGRKSRSYLADLVRIYLSERAGWKRKPRYKLEIQSGKIQKITLPPSGLAAFAEVGIPFPLPIFFGLFLAPLSCLVEGLLIALLNIWIPVLDNYLDIILPICILCHVLIAICLGIKLMNAPVTITLERRKCSRKPGQRMGDDSVSKVLTVRRCLWGKLCLVRRFALDGKPVRINIGREEEAERSFIRISQGDKKAGIGTVLNFDEKRELKSVIKQMIAGL